MTGPGLPLLAMWMCAATALPVSRANVSRQVTVRVAPSVATVATNEPVARRTFPFGFGTSCLALSVTPHRCHDTDLTAHLTRPVRVGVDVHVRATRVNRREQRRVHVCGAARGGGADPQSGTTTGPG